MAVQHNKCANCERRLASEKAGGGIEHDLEHFRPKSSVDEWPGGTGFAYPTGPAHPDGYYWLAYHLLNYATACKKCNSPLKDNYFPVSDARGSATTEPAALNQFEKPFLVYPLGDIDDDPEEIITFLGVNAVPAKRTGPRRRRADVTIRFFKLNDPEREELLRGRATLLDHFGNHIETINDPRVSVARKNKAQETVTRMLRPSSEHTACVRAMANLYRVNPDQARELIRAAREYLDSVG